jgi:hypothetical protein
VNLDAPPGNELVTSTTTSTTTNQNASYLQGQPEAPKTKSAAAPNNSTTQQKSTASTPAKNSSATRSKPRLERLETRERIADLDRMR